MGDEVSTSSSASFLLHKNSLDEETNKTQFKKVKAIQSRFPFGTPPCRRQKEIKVDKQFKNKKHELF